MENFIVMEKHMMIKEDCYITQSILKNDLII